MTLLRAIHTTINRQLRLVGWVLGAALGLATLAQAAETGPRWAELGGAEQRVLLPLRDQWQEIDAARKLKWRELAQRYPNLSVEQQQRIRDRMLEWAKLSVAERNAARMRFQAANQLPADERKAKWDAYQSLPEAQRRELIDRAESRQQQAAIAKAAAKATTSPPSKLTAVDHVQPKNNIVPDQTPPRPKPVAMGTVQAGVGASTRPITQPPQPPRHQQAGQPKIAATPEFVDRSTLLPRDPHPATELRASQ